MMFALLGDTGIQNHSVTSGLIPHANGPQSGNRMIGRGVLNPNSIIRLLLVPTALSEESEKKEGLVEALF